MATKVTTRKLIIDIVSDTVWPWCFVGKRRLEDAIGKAKSVLPQVEFEINWRPFQLNPSAPEGKGVNKMDMYNEKFGKDRVNAMIPRMIKTGKTHGINFSYGGFTGKKSCFLSQSFFSVLFWK